MSVWIFYAARRRLTETKSFIWFDHGFYYPSVKEGVYEMPLNGAALIFAILQI